MTSFRGTADRLPTTAHHRPAAGNRSVRPDGRTATAARLLRSRLGRQLVLFGAIGIASTAAYAVLYLLLRSFVDPTAANALALLVTALGNTAANRRLTFGVRGRRSMVCDQVGGLAALGIALAITTVSVSLLDAIAPGAGRTAELAVLVIANALATLARFVLLRGLIGANQGHAPVAAASSSPAVEY
jgi:putative flippase GtrA